MSPIGPPDTHHLTAAVGWLELGNPAEAANELARIQAEHLNCLEVLQVRWQVCAELKHWDAALTVAEVLIRVAPGDANSWLHQAYALRRATGGGLEKAWDVLRPAYEQFPNVAIIPYNLACYTAQLGQLTEAWEWLRKAIGVGDLKILREMALGDRDLEPLWDRIREL